MAEPFHDVATDVVNQDPEGVDETGPVSRVAVESRRSRRLRNGRSSASTDETRFILSELPNYPNYPIAFTKLSIFYPP